MQHLREHAEETHGMHKKVCQVKKNISFFSEEDEDVLDLIGKINGEAVEKLRRSWGFQEK